MNTIRCFLAVKLDIEVARALAKRERELKARCDEIGLRVAWVPPTNMHITIRFLGQIAEPMADALKNMLEALTSEINPFYIESAGLGAFPSLERPRIIWAGISRGQEELGQIFNSVSARLLGAGFRFDETPFRSHVTIGRVKDGPIQELSSCLTQGENAFGTTYVRNLCCYRSDLSNHGAEYHSLWRLPLRGGSPQGAKPEGTQKTTRDERPTQNEGEESSAKCASLPELNGEPHDDNVG